ncbi:MAG: thioredoxin fold domain-containing protein [Limnohabitans sp.]
MWTNRRQSLQALMVGGLGWGVSAHAAPVVLPSTDSLSASLEDALRLKQPLVVMVSLQGCPFCKVVRENYLNPLRASGLQVVQIDMRDHRPLIDFTGATTTHDAWIRQQRVKIAPTVLFFGAQGREVATRLNGAYLPDFYGAYLDEQLAVARKAVQGSGA